MAYARSCKHACIYVPPLQTLLVFIVSTFLLLASMLSVAAAVAAEPPPGGYRFGLTHVNARGNFTERSRLRGRRTSAALLGDYLESSRGASTPPKKSKVHFSEDEYLMEVEVGGGQSPPKYQALIDTGSSLIWLKPRPKPTTSSHISLPDSNRQACKGDGLCAPCKCERGGGCGCKYETVYGDGVLSSGCVCHETLLFARLDQHRQLAAGSYYCPAKNIAVGWSDSQETKCAAKHPGCKDLKKYDGVVGLGRGKRSLVTQLKVHNFSYCLTTYEKPRLISPLLLGSPDALKPSCEDPNNDHCKVHATSLLQDERDPFKYYVHLDYIQIGGKRIDLPKQPKTKEEEEEAAATGSSEAKIEKTPNMFIDSGATFTHLENTTHQALLEHLNGILKKNATEVDSSFCWTDTTEELPRRLSDLELHFAGGAVMYLHYDKIVELNETSKELCLTIQRADNELKDKDGHGVSVLGNFQQQNIHMHFDLHNNNLSFVKVDNCTKV